HQEALHRRDEVSGRTYRELIGELVALEMEGALPDVLELRGKLGCVESERVGEAVEVCAGLAALWLSSEFENSPLVHTKAFGWEQALVARFVPDFEAFCEAEKHRSALSATSSVTLEVSEEEPLREWVGRYRDKLCTLSQDDVDAL